MEIEIGTPSMEEMKKIWQQTFGDSQQYTDLVYRLFYDTENCLGAYHNGKLVSVLTAVPYTFGNKKGNTVTGLYLCGLATDPEYRGHGIMQQLISEIENRARLNGNRFTLLIPADNHLRNYYAKLGYQTLMNIKEAGIGSECENRKKTTNDTESLKFSILANEQNKHLKEITTAIQEHQAQYPGISIHHTLKDIEGILEECLISNGDILWNEVDREVVIIEDEKVRLITSTENTTLNKTIKYLSEKYGDIKISLPEQDPVWRAIETHREQIRPYVMFKSTTTAPIPEPISAYLLLD